MRLDRLDPATLDHRTAERCAAIMNASATAAGVDVVPANGATFAALSRYTHDLHPVDGLWVARDGGEIVGHATIQFARWDNPELALAFCSVQPEHCGQGVGTALQDAQTTVAQGAGRTSLLTFAAGTPTISYLTGSGWQVAQRTVQRRLRPQDLDYEAIQRYADEAAEHAAAYELIRLDGRAPEEWLPTLQHVHEAINDAPLDEIDLAPDEYPVERIRAYESAMEARQQRLYRLMARHRESGAWAGHTIVCVDGHRPGVGIQEDTSVISAHRGHRLGMLLKAGMLLWLRDEQPGLEVIDTWNAESNTHMIAVNERLGCTVNARGVALQRSLADGTSAD